MQRKSGVLGVFVMVFGFASGWALHVAAEENAAGDTAEESAAQFFSNESAAFIAVTNGVASAANIRGESIISLCELTRRAAVETGDASFQKPLDRCALMVVQHERFVGYLVEVIEHVAALDALTNVPEVDVAPLPPRAFLDQWQRERQAILAGLRRLLARERELTLKSALLEVMFQRRYGVQRANSALARIGHPQRISQIRAILDHVEQAVRALEAIPLFRRMEPGAPAPHPSTPPARPLPKRGDGVPA